MRGCTLGAIGDQLIFCSFKEGKFSGGLQSDFFNKETVAMLV